MQDCSLITNDVSAVVCACDIDALKDFEKHDLVGQPVPCAAVAAPSVAAEQQPSVNRSAVGIHFLL